MNFDTNFIQNKIKEVLGSKFNYRIYGIGRNQVLELEVPEEMASKESQHSYTAMSEEEQVKEYKKILAERGEEAAKIFKAKLEKMQDGRLRFPKGHPKEGEICGDIRSLVIGNRSEEEIVGWLNLVKSKIVKEFTNAQKPVPQFT